MCLFCKKKKKDYTVLKIVAIVVGVLAAVAAGYVVFDKFLKDKIFKKKAVCEACAEDACLEGECCAEEAEAPVEEVTVEEAAE